jgi:hypothetical protein
MASLKPAELSPQLRLWAAAVGEWVPVSYTQQPGGQSLLVITKNRQLRLQSCLLRCRYRLDVAFLAKCGVRAFRNRDSSVSPMRHLSAWVAEFIKLLVGRRLHPLLTQCPICQPTVHLHINRAGRQHVFADACGLYEGCRLCKHYVGKVWAPAR